MGIKGIRRIAKKPLKSGTSADRIVKRDPKIKNKAPMAEGVIPVLTDKQFASLFSLFRKAVSHEVGNSLMGLKLPFMRERKNLYKDFERFCHVNTVIELLGSLGKGRAVYFDSDSRFSIFTEEDLGLLKIKKEGNKYYADIEGMKKVALKYVREFRETIYKFIELDINFSEERHQRKLDRTLEFGRLLSNSLEKLLLDNLNLDAEVVKKTVWGKESSVRSTISEARRTTKCTVTFESLGEGIKDAQVLVNPVFSFLIFRNILSNAETAMKAKELEPHVDVFIYSNNGTVVFEFMDQGCGMTAEVMEKLNAGERVTTKEGEGNHGLGFRYCRELAKKMGGKLYVSESVIGEGTTVSLELDIAN